MHNKQSEERKKERKKGRKEGRKSEREEEECLPSAICEYKEAN
jgi:hypothetical protein